MAIIKKVVKEITVLKKVNLKEKMTSELKLYLDFLGYDEGEEKEGFDRVVNESLEYVFSKDKDFIKYKETKAKNTKNEDTNKSENESTNE